MKRTWTKKRDQITLTIASTGINITVSAEKTATIRHGELLDLTTFSLPGSPFFRLVSLKSFPSPNDIFPCRRVKRKERLRRRLS